MNASETFEIWAPAGSIWSPWVKPVLFACHDGAPQPWRLPAEPVEVNWAPVAQQNVAVVIDLPGASSVAMGLAMAGRGFRPVPLYNAVAGPVFGLDNAVWISSMVDVRPIMEALWQGANTLPGLNLPPGAPPVFLLDANRRTGTGYLSPGVFDNRSVSFVTDFPSANKLWLHAIHEVWLIQASGSQPQADLSHTLLRWQQAGITIKIKTLDSNDPPTVCLVTKPPLYRRAWYGLLTLAGLRRSELGGFGGLIPIPSAG